MAKQPAKGRKAANDGVETTDQAAEMAESATSQKPLIDAIPPEVHQTSTPPSSDVIEDATLSVEPETPPDPVPTPSPAPEPKPASGGGFLPLTLGGLIAGVIGFAVATLTAPASDDRLSVELAQQSATLAALEERLAATPEVDLSGVEASIAEQIAAVQAELAEINVRIDALEARPEVIISGDADANPGVSPDITAAMTADMDALRAQLAEMAEAAQTELEDARAAAAEIEENAAAAARTAALAAQNAAARAALARVQSALESGAPIGLALSELEAATGDAAPEALLAVVDGVPTLPMLQDGFPDAARAALAIARSEGVAGEETSGIGAFIRNQFDVRSTAPREGDSADAVLSRAEAALRAGRLSDALAELGALPEVARAEMSGWLAQAEARANALTAVDMLSSTLSDN